MTNESATRPPIVDQAAFQAELDTLRAREKAHTRDFMGWDVPWYSARESATALLPPPRRPGMMHLVCYLDSPPGWPQECTHTRTMDGPPAWTPVPEWPAGRPIPQWIRLAAGYSDDLGTARP